MKVMMVELTDEQANSLSKQIESTLRDNLDFVLGMLNMFPGYKIEKEDLLAFFEEQFMPGVWETGLEEYVGATTTELLFDLYICFRFEQSPNYKSENDPIIKALVQDGSKWLK
ncbi:MAG: hypothetical protein M0R38_12505 [Bacteroidia bacterium]|nr:hypothetical protein [Bacteroidia bacterium]